MDQVKMAIIGGSGFYDPGLFAEVREVSLTTPYGEIKPFIGKLAHKEVAFLPRHGANHSVLPHQVNYRANLWGLKSMGVQRILATTAVGSLQPKIGPGMMVLVDQFLDFTKQRPLTFFDQNEVHRAHIDVSQPYCRELRGYLKKAALDLNLKIVDSGCYVCTEGPRYETTAEVKMFNKMGGTVAGMTGVPEVVLARELGICYANISIVTNWAAGISKKPLAHSDVVQIMSENQNKLRSLIITCLNSLNDQPGCSYSSKKENF